MNFSISDVSFAEVIERSPNGVLIVDEENNIILVNHHVELMFGYDRSELLGQSVDMLVPTEFRGAHFKNRDSYMSSPHSRSFGAESGLTGWHKSGYKVPVEIGLTPMETTAGRKVLVSIVDITYRRKAEEHREMLLKELSHRVKNNMAIVGSIAMMTKKNSANIDEFFTSFAGRLNALAVAHTLLATSEWNHAEISKLISEVLMPFRANDGRLTTNGPAVHIHPLYTSTLSIVIHELATNAAKYGALSLPSGSVDVTWERVDNKLFLVWRELGGPKVSRPEKVGFGTTMIERSVINQLNGEVDMNFVETGLVFKMTIPLDLGESFAT